MSYQLILLDPRTGEVIQTWTARPGEPPFTAFQATELALHIAAACPELHRGGHQPYLSVRPCPAVPALVPAVPAPAAPSGVAALVYAAVSRVRPHILVERHVATGREVRRRDVDGRGRPLTRWTAALLRRAEYRARPQSAHPWTYLSVEPTTAAG